MCAGLCGGQVKNVIATGQYICAISVIRVHIIGGQVFKRDCDGDRFRSSGFQHLGFVKAHKLYLSRFHAAVGIGLLDVQLNDVLSGHASAIGCLNRKYVLEAMLLRILCGNIGDLFLKGRIGEPVSERIGNDALISVSVFIGNIIPIAFRVCSLIPAVSYIDSLAAIGVGADGLAAFIHIGCLCAVGGIVIRGCFLLIHPGVHQAPGRIRLSIQKCGNAVGAIQASATHPEDGICILHHRAKLHDIRTVDQGDDFKTFLIQTLQQCLFILAQFE